ncbi:hypothetical protein K4K51_008768 [Colletotrichum sp. SAR 10_75]|nr:hypothetical protein K4K51_008768 [Colletotrichum sp. SAR 10_75]
MKFFTAVAIIPTIVSALAIRAAPAPAPGNNWDVYAQNTAQLKSRGLCRAYVGRDKPTKAVWGANMCTDVCAPAKQLAKDQKVFSVTCLGSGPAKGDFPDPEGYRYNLGQCKCNDPVINWITEKIVVEGLPALGLVTCSVFKIAVTETFDLLTGVARGALGTGTQTLAKVAKALIKAGKGSSDWEAYVKEHLAAGDACDFSAAKLFNDFGKLTDYNIANVM